MPESGEYVIPGGLPAGQRRSRAEAANNPATAQQAQHRHPEAAELLRRALAVFERTLEPSHPSLEACRENYANAAKQGL